MIDAFNPTLPPERNKQNRVHRQPLSHRAMALLTELAAVRTSPLLFPSSRRGAIPTPKVLNRFSPAGAQRTTIYGMRSSFRDWAGDNDAGPLPWQVRIERETAEACLAHIVGN